MKMKIKLTADELMNVVDAAMDEAIDRGYGDDEETVDDMLHIVDAALSAMGIEISEDEDEDDVDAFGVPTDYDSDFDEDEDEDEEEEEPFNPITKLLVERNGELYLKESDASVLLNAMRELVYSKTEGMPEIIREQILCDMWCKIGEENRIKGVLKGE